MKLEVTVLSAISPLRPQLVTSLAHHVISHLVDTHRAHGTPLSYVYYE
jgi:hypothetical protein